MDDEYEGFVEINDDDLNDFLREKSKNEIGRIKIGVFDQKSGEMRFEENNKKYHMMIHQLVNVKKVLGKRINEDLVIEEDGNGRMMEGKISEVQTAYSGNMHKKESKTIDQEINLNRLPKAVLSLNPEKMNTYISKMDPEELRSSLFEMFSEKPTLNFDEIQSVLNQPRGYLQQHLEDICLKKKEKNKFIYFLKDTYRRVLDDGVAKKKIKNI